MLQNVTQDLGLWMSGVFNRKCSMKAVGKELVECKLDLVGVEVRWQKGDNELADTYAFLYESGKGY